MTHSLTQLQQLPSHIALSHLARADGLPDDLLHDALHGLVAPLLLHQGAVLLHVYEGEVGEGPGCPQLTLPGVADAEEADDGGQAVVVDVSLGVDVPPTADNNVEDDLQ